MRLSIHQFKSAARTGKKVRGAITLEKATFASAEILTDSASDRRVKFVFSTSTPDRDNDVIVPAGIDTANYLANPVILWGHDHGSTPIGKCISVTAEKNQLVGVVEFFPREFPVSGEQAEAALQCVKQGVCGTSIGFLPVEYKYDESSDGMLFTKIQLLEISVVSIPCNQEALAIIEDAPAEDKQEDKTDDEKSVAHVEIKTIETDFRARLLRLF